MGSAFCVGTLLHTCMMCAHILRMPSSSMFGCEKRMPVLTVLVVVVHLQKIRLLRNARSRLFHVMTWYGCDTLPVWVLADQRAVFSLRVRGPSPDAIYQLFTSHDRPRGLAAALQSKAAESRTCSSKVAPLVVTNVPLFPT